MTGEAASTVRRAARTEKSLARLVESGGFARGRVS
jgi:hypothetical protein